MLFINNLLEYRKYEKAINSFGEIFLKEYIKKPGAKKSKIGYYNSKTKKYILYISKNLPKMVDYPLVMLKQVFIIVNKLLKITVIEIVLH